MPFLLMMNLSMTGVVGQGVNDTGGSGSPDTTNPTLFSTVPADNDTGISIATAIVLTFDEAVALGSGNITLRKNDTGFANDAVYNVATDTGRVSVSGLNVTITPASNLDNNTEYAIQIDATAIDDLVGNSFAGIADDTTLSWTTTPLDTGSIVMGYQSTQDEGTSFTWYVDNVNGNDTGHAGASVGDAFGTVGAAVNVADTGDTIGVRNVSGIDYNELITVTKGIGIYGYSTEKPVFSGGVDLPTTSPCDTGDEAIVGSNYTSMFKVEGIAKSSFVDSDPFNAHLVENNTQMTIAMGRLPNPVYPQIESYNLDWIKADTTVLNAGNAITGYIKTSFSDRYTKEQIENCDIRGHRTPNGAYRVPVLSFDTGTSTINIDRTGQDTGFASYESNIYRDRFALVNLAPAIQKGEWAFLNDTGSTINIYFWPTDTGNVNSAVQYSNLETIISNRTGSPFTLQSVVVQQASASNPSVGSTTPIRLDPSVGNGDVGKATVHNIWSRNHYSKDDGYGHIYLRKRGGYSITQNTFEDARNQFGVFLSGSYYDTGDLRTDSGDFSRNIIRNADKSPIRIYGNLNNTVTRNHFISSGLAAHANLGNHYEGGSKSLWAHNFWFACSGYWTWQETDSQDFIGNWATGHLTDGRTVVDQNRETSQFSAATFFDQDAISYILNNDLVPTQSGSIETGTFQGMSALGNVGDSGVRFVVMNNQTYGASITDPYFIKDWQNNVFTGGTVYDTGTDIEHTYTEVYKSISLGSYGIDTGSPTRSEAGASIQNLADTGSGTITLSSRWPNYDFGKDINNDTWNLAAPGVGPAVNPDNYPDFDPVWVIRPEMSGTPAIGNEMSVSEGTLAAINNYPTKTYQWCRVSDPYLHVSLWPTISGATSSTYTIDTGDVGSYVGVKIAGGGAETQVIKTTPTLTTYPISLGSLLVQDHNDSGSLAVNTWITSAPFTYDGGPLLVLMPMHMSTSAGDPAPEMTIGDTGRVEGTGTSLTMATDTGVANRASNKLYYANIISGDTGTVTLHYRVTAQGTDSMGVYAWPAPGLSGFGSYGNVTGTSSALELESEVDTTAINGIVLHMLVRQSISSTAYDAPTWTGATSLLDSGYSGQLANTNSTLFSVAQEDASSIETYGASVSWTETRASGMISLELLSDTGVISGDVTAPTLQSTSPVDNDTGIATSSVLTGTFSENIQFGTGNITLRKNDTGFANAAVYDVTTDTGRVSISGAVLTITPAASLDSGTEYSVQIDATAIDDTGPASPNSFAGISDDTTWSFTTQPAASVTDILAPYGDFSTDTGRWGYDAGQATITGGVAQFNTDTNFRGIFLEGLNRVPAPESTTLDLQFTISNFVSGSRVWINVQPVDTGGADIGSSTTIYDTNSDSGISNGTWSKTGAYTTPAGTAYLEISGFDAVVQPGQFDLDDFKLTYTS